MSEPLDVFIANQIQSGQGIGEYYAENPSPITETSCGPGSTMEATSHVREWLPKIIATYNIRTMLDAPCGDLNWISRVDLGDVIYTGWDISIGTDIQQQTWPHILHGTNLLTVEQLPSVDLILCRDFLIHMPNEAIMLMLNKFRDSDSRYLATTHCPDATNDDPCPLDGGQRWAGYFDRAINLTKPPFGLHAPIAMCPDPIPSCYLWENKQLALFDLSTI